MICSQHWSRRRVPQREPGRLADRTQLRGRRSRNREVPPQAGSTAVRLERNEGADLERAEVNDELDLPDGHAPALVVPQSFVRRTVAIKARRSFSSSGISRPRKAHVAAREQLVPPRSGPSMPGSGRASRTSRPRTPQVCWRGEAPGGVGDLQADHQHLPGIRAKKTSSPRVDVESGTARSRFNKLQPPGRLQRRRGDVAAPGQRSERGCPPAQASPLGRPGTWSMGPASGSRKEVRKPCRATPACRLGLCRAQRVTDRHGSPDLGVRSAARFQEHHSSSRISTHGLCPAQRERSEAPRRTSSSGSGAASRRSQAHKSRSASGSVTSASAAVCGEHLVPAGTASWPPSRWRVPEPCPGACTDARGSASTSSHHFSQCPELHGPPSPPAHGSAPVSRPPPPPPAVAERLPAAPRTSARYDSSS